VRRRARRRGVSTTSAILEAALVMGWFVVLLLGERAVSTARDARHEAEEAAQESAVHASAHRCEGGSAGRARITVTAGGKLDVSAAISLLMALGHVSGARTWSYYVKSLEKVETNAVATERNVAARRTHGCLEKPLDVPHGTMPTYRQAFWLQNLKGY
jgi:hypothetical protein